jgi:hypothetical protein
VTPEQIKQIRTDLRCTVRELASSLGAPAADVQAWEAGTQFPTKRWVNRLESLRDKGPNALLGKSAEASGKGASPMAQLDNPEVWQLIRKLLAYPQLFSEVSQIAKDYEDPASASREH